MNRLRDEASPETSDAAALLRALAPDTADTPGTDEAMQARVWTRLHARPRRATRSRLTPALAALAVLAIGAFAAASILRARHHASAPSPVAPHVSAPRSGSTAVVTPPPPLPSVPLPPPSSVRRTSEHHTPPRNVEPSTPAVPAAAAEPAALLLQHATRALRFDHDAERAATLADEYLARHAAGDLAEEALAIAMEAHAQLDDGQAAALAARYLARFPDGRFRATAEHLR